MGYSLPSIFALQAFDAAARHMSFKDAAHELSLTPGAISQKIKKLEDLLGNELFDRTQTQIKLTVFGREYLPAIRQSLAQISEATRIAKRRCGPSTLNVSVTPLFAIKLFIPVLSRFNDLYPDITINTCTTVRLVNFDVENVDMAIRDGLGRYPGLTCHKLFSDELVLICSPALLDGPKPLKSLQDLRRHTLLHHDHRQSWQPWFDAVGLKNVEIKKGPVFSDDSLVMQAAIEGQGVALGRRALVQSDIDKGVLVAPFDITVPSQYAFHLVYPTERSDDPVLRTFRDWFLKESGICIPDRE